MKAKTGRFGVWNKRDYQGRYIVAVYDREVYDWLVVQTCSDIEIYNNRELRNMSFNPIAVGVDSKLYTLLCLRFSPVDYY